MRETRLLSALINYSTSIMCTIVFRNFFALLMLNNILKKRKIRALYMKMKKKILIPSIQSLIISQSLTNILSCDSLLYTQFLFRKLFFFFFLFLKPKFVKEIYQMATRNDFGKCSLNERGA